MTKGFQRVVLTLLLASSVGMTLGGCLLVPVPIGGGHRHHQHDRR